MAAYLTVSKPLFIWFAVVAMSLSPVNKTNLNESFLSQGFLPYGFSMTSLRGRNEVDPYKTITLEAIGLGTRLSKVELLDGTGKVLYEANNQTRINLLSPLAFETRHTIKVTAERTWTAQSETREINFTTVAIPTLEGSALRVLEPDASVTLHFNRPVGDVLATGDLTLSAKPDASGQIIRLQASAYMQNHSYPVQLNYKTTKGVPLPPLNLEIRTPPALVAETNVRGLSDLGLMLPLQITFSEPLAEKANTASHLQVLALNGKDIPGKWRWTGQRQLRFTPHPAWPASSTIKIKADEKNLKSEHGGMLEKTLVEQFTTGPDRKIFVYLGSQTVEAVENGKVIRTFKVSTGKSKTPTVTGTYFIYDRYRRKTMRSDVGEGQPGYYEVKNVPYTQFFHKDYAFHGAFWHNSFGRPASHGCVNMATKDQNKRWPHAAEDAGWLYQWGALGMPVTVTHKKSATKQAGLVPTKLSNTVKEKTGALSPKMANR
jgi:lipoprotein-anchoring transpeptidase ErfK/SrfK